VAMAESGDLILRQKAFTTVWIINSALLWQCDDDEI
jgi:hypothetical protein